MRELQSSDLAMTTAVTIGVSGELDMQSHQDTIASLAAMHQATIVAGTPHVAWYLRLLLAVVAFLYISGQSAAYLYTSNSDQG